MSGKEKRNSPLHQKCWTRRNSESQLKKSNSNRKRTVSCADTSNGFYALPKVKSDYSLHHKQRANSISPTKQSMGTQNRASTSPEQCGTPTVPNAYAPGGHYVTAPMPDSLPPPPSDWIGMMPGGKPKSFSTSTTPSKSYIPPVSCSTEDHLFSVNAISAQLKALLKVQA